MHPEWQDIETAPKDRPIMVADGQGGMAFVEWLAWGEGYGQWNLLDAGSYASDGQLDWTPTHWAERPQGPQEVKMNLDWHIKPLTYRLRYVAEEWGESDMWRDEAGALMREAATAIDRLTAENNRLNEAYAIALAELETLRD